MSWLKKALKSNKIMPTHYLVWCALLVCCGILLTSAFNQKAEKWLIYGLLLGCFSVLQFLLSGTKKLHKLAHTSQLIGIVTGFIATGILASAFELSRNQHVLLNMPASGNITAVIEHISVRQEEQRMRLYLKLIDSSQPAFKGLSRVRVTTASTELQAGMEIKAHVRLFPLGLPAFSGRPDYARQHYLSGLSATGFIYQINDQQMDSSPKLSYRLVNWRQDFAQRLNQQMRAPYGSIAAALLVGIRDYIPAQTYDHFKASGLAHLLAISGLHMGLFCFAIYGALRYAMALFPSFAQKYAIHKIAALVALLAGGLYLCLSGFPVSAIRAFLMAFVVIMAILYDRHALTVRNLALVAIFMLLVHPSVIYTAGFQLSFLASFAIISVLHLFRGIEIQQKYLRWLYFMLVSSALASLISIPVIAYHFAQFTFWGVLANLLAIPLTGMMIMPTGIVVLISSALQVQPFFAMASWLMSYSLMILTHLSEFVAAFPFAGIYIKPPPAILIMLFSTSAVLMMEKALSLRLAGHVVLLIGALFWFLRPVPHIALLHANQHPILVARTSENMLVTTARLSDFWKKNLHVVFGQRNVETARCADQPVCALSLKDGPNIVWVQRRSDLTQACKTGADYIFSAQTAYYPCASNTQIHAFRLRPNERHLIWFNNGRVTQASNYDNIRPLAWHMPYQ